MSDKANVKIRTRIYSNHADVKEGEKPYLFFVLQMDLMHPIIGWRHVNYKIAPDEFMAYDWPAKRDQALSRLAEALIGNIVEACVNLPPDKLEQAKKEFRPAIGDDTNGL